MNEDGKKQKQNTLPYDYVLDFGSKKVNLVDKNGMGVQDDKGEEFLNQEYKNDYDYKKLLSDMVKAVPEPILLDNAVSTDLNQPLIPVLDEKDAEDTTEKWNLKKYMTMVKKYLGDRRCVARFTGSHRPKPGKKVEKSTDKLMAGLAKLNIEAKLLPIEDEAYFGSRNAFAIMQPYFPEAQKFKVLEIGSGSNQIGEFTLQKQSREARSLRGGDANLLVPVEHQPESPQAGEPMVAAALEPKTYMYQVGEKVQAFLRINGQSQKWMEATIVKAAGSDGKYGLEVVEKNGTRFTSSKRSRDIKPLNQIRRRLASCLENRPIHKLATLIQQAQA